MAAIAPPNLLKQLRNDFTLGQRHRPIKFIKDLMMWIDPQAMVNRGCKIRRFCWIKRWIRCIAITAAMNYATLDAATRKHRGKAVGPMIPAIFPRTRTAHNRLPNSGGPPHFTRPQYQGIIQHPPLFKIIK